MDKPGLICPYTIRESKRAKRVTLRITRGKGLEVVIPAGFNRHGIPDIVAEKREWIQRVMKEFQREGKPLDDSPLLPESINLRALKKIFAVRYKAWNGERYQLVQSSDSELDISCDLTAMDAQSNVKACRHLLHEWLKTHGRMALIPWLNAMSVKTGLSYRTARVRAQKTRWGSCSSEDGISLNCKLLLLPAELVDYILVHELCHTVHRNHSERFWGLVNSFEPHWRTLEKRLREASKGLPSWAM